jgi:hypothetical protein
MSQQAAAMFDEQVMVGAPSRARWSAFRKKPVLAKAGIADFSVESVTKSKI